MPSKIDVIASIGEDLKESINDLIFTIQKLRKEVDDLQAWKDKMTSEKKNP